MSTSTPAPATPPAGPPLAAFLRLLPCLETHARVAFRDLRCPAARADRVAECAALAWKWYARLCERGKDVGRFQMVFIYLVARAVRAGRKAAGAERARDALNPFAQRRGGFRVDAFPTAAGGGLGCRHAAGGRSRPDAFEDWLRDNTATPVPDQVQFRLDFPAWLGTLTGRERRLVRALARGERTQEVGRRFGLSPARVSQLRREFKEGWDRFCGDAGETPKGRRAGQRVASGGGVDAALRQLQPVDG